MLIKRFVSILLCALLVVLLSSCANNSNSQNNLDVGEDNQTEVNNQTEITTDPETAYKKSLELLGNPMVTSVSGTSKKSTHIYKIDESGVNVRFILIEGIKSGKQVNILHATDFHFNKLNDKDIAENNPCVAATKKVRSAYSDESTLANTQKVLAYADKFDAVAITGDNIDYLTWGSLEMLKEHIFEPLGEKVIMALGGHDTTRLMETGSPADPTTLQSRYDIIASYYPHDIYYSSKILENRVMLIQMDNGTRAYTEEQLNKFKADIEKARKENLVILLFQHEPMATGNTKDSALRSISGAGKHNFYREAKVGSKHVADGVSEVIYKLITENADIIKGLFCGHIHDDFYTEIKASYIKDGKKVETTIPQIVLSNTASKPIMNIIMVD